MKARGRRREEGERKVAWLSAPREVEADPDPDPDPDTLTLNLTPTLTLTLIPTPRRGGDSREGEREGVGRGRYHSLCELDILDACDGEELDHLLHRRGQT